MSWITTITDVAEIVVKILHSLDKAAGPEPDSSPEHWTGEVKWTFVHVQGGPHQVNAYNTSDKPVCLLYSKKEPLGEKGYLIQSEPVDIDSGNTINQVREIQEWGTGKLSINPAEKPGSNNRFLSFAAATFATGITVNMVSRITFTVEGMKTEGRFRYKVAFTSRPPDPFNMKVRCTDNENRSVQAEATFQHKKEGMEGESFDLPDGIDLSGGILELSGEIEVSQNTYESILRASDEQRAERINARMGRESA